MSEETVLETDVFNNEPGHAAKHNAVNAQVNWLTQRVQGVAAATSTTISRLFKLTPHETGAPPFELVSKEFANPNDWPRNVLVAMGFNASEYLQNGSGDETKPRMMLNFEAGYGNPDDDTYGPEIYVDNGSGGTGVASFRPFYVRTVLETLADGPLAPAGQYAHVLHDIGEGSGGIFAVGAGNAVDGKTLFYVKGTETIMSSDNIVAEGGTFAVRPAAGPNTPAILIVDSKGTGVAVLGLRVGAASAFAFVAESVDELVINDKADQPVAVFNYGATEATRFAQFLSNVNVSKVLNVTGDAGLAGHVYAGTSTGAPTAANTGNLGAGAPAIAVAGNCVRGTVAFGTGTAPGAGDVIELTLPTPFNSTPSVVVSPANFATGSQPIYAYAVDADTIRIGVTGALAASAAAGAYKVNYQIIG